MQHHHPKKAMEVLVMGQKFHVRSDTTNDQYIEQVAGYVDQKIGEVQRNTKSVASLNVAILAAMNITDEYLKFRREQEERNKVLEKKIQDLIEIIDLQL